MENAFKNELLNEVKLGNLTFTEAAAYEKMYNESLYTTESMDDDSVAGLIVLAIFACGIAAGIIAKIKGDKNFERNIKDYPELAESLKEAEAIREKLTRIKERYEVQLARLASLAADYNELAKVLGAPTVKVETKTKSSSDFEVTGLDEAAEWSTTSSTTKEEQNNRYDPIKARKVKKLIADISVTATELASTINQMENLIEKSRTATNNAIRILRKAKSKVEKDENQARLKAAKETNDNIKKTYEATANSYAKFYAFINECITKYENATF